MNKLQERALRVAYNYCDSSFSELLEVLNKFTIHIMNTKVLMTKIYKFLNVTLPPIMNDIFRKQKNYYPLRKPMSLDSKKKITTTYGIDNISFREPQIR